MAIAPKNPRKRAAKKTPKVKGEVSLETTAAPIIQSAKDDSVSLETADKKAKPVKKAVAVPVAIFQAAPVAEKAPAKKAPAKKSVPTKSSSDNSEGENVNSDAKSESDSDNEEG